jgi:16S rRNA (guanine966-N2)-methyltransferase
MSRAPNQVRIIGGLWRGRKLVFPEHAALRPTPDRVRETLFNWLAPVIAGARCLDLFAGSGALGFEALSRGAARCVLVERDAALACVLNAHRTRLTATQAEVVTSEALRYLEGVPTPFDIVFLDPPYAETALLERCCQRLGAGGWLSPDARIYAECARAATPAWPASWVSLRQKAAGAVGYHLFARTRPESP